VSLERWTYPFYISREKPYSGAHSLLKIKRARENKERWEGPYPPRSTNWGSFPLCGRTPDTALFSALAPVVSLSLTS
jgi:hypothetical protein